MKQRLRTLFCDQLNLARGKYLPFGAPSSSASETRFCRGVYAVTYDKELIPAPGSKMLEGLPDIIACYKTEEIRKSWHPGVSVVICDLLESDRQPLNLCARTLLKRTVSQWQEAGYTPKVGIELEAFAFVRNHEGKWQPYDTPGAFVYSTGPFTDPLGITDAIWERANDCGFQLEMITSEYDSPQFEYTLKYDDAVKAVDDIFLFRLMAREVAIEHGVLLTFMPKPILTAGGSGVHINFSLNDRKGNNIIGDAKDETRISEIGQRCVAGLMHHHKGLAGILAPIENSYHRLQPASLSGYWRNWAVDHRGVTTRISGEVGSHARIEHRMADGAVNPYLATAAVLQAARLGVMNKYELQAAETGDCVQSQDAVDGVAATLDEALDDLVADADLVQAVGETLVQNLVAIKRAELATTANLSWHDKVNYHINYL